MIESDAHLMSEKHESGLLMRGYSDTLGKVAAWWAVLGSLGGGRMILMCLL